MAYDRSLKEWIDGLNVAQLIHYMNTQYDPDIKEKGPEFQSTGYFWAYERLSQLFPN